MKWWPWSRRARKSTVNVEQDEAMEELEERIREADQKLQETRAQLPQMDKAVAKARTAQFKVDRFTREMERSYRRAHEQPGSS